MTKEQKILETQKELNERLAKKLATHGITNLKLTSLGNSIASGYSMTRITKPLLLRNESIQSIMKKQNIYLERYHFARSQNNNDEHILEWLTSNIKESEMHSLNRIDYGNGPNHMITYGLNKEKLEEYYNTNPPMDKGLQEILFEKNNNLANIIIYNGATGSFLDNITRNGKLSQKLTYGIKRDIISLEATLKIIQEKNRNSSLNIQLYLCGAPNFLGLHISDIINYKLQNLAKNYAFVTYVEPVKSKLLYPNYEKEQKIQEKLSFLKKISILGIDIHYDEIEYLELNNHILEAIIEEYSFLKEQIRIDRELSSFNKQLEGNLSLRKLGDESIEKTIEEIIYQQNFSKDAIDKIQNYLIQRFPYDFYYLDKKKLNKVLRKSSREN